MPLVKFDILEGRSEAQITSMLDAAHRAVVDSFQVPEGDRYQVVSEHRASHLIIEDTGLGITRTDNMVMLTVISRPRSTDAKQMFYRELTHLLQKHCDIAPSDVVVSFVINSDEDWSFGHGVAQFLTGEL
ncbi:tautomerase family protein [Paraburkholderia panacisoli]|uniref:Tautomerase family protein n=1 Tax=Paraburkholderia panacisoli TaxID=2603818 RepID=A0A5B0G7F4_9BURK|nr:tautomerase family protein [Paraburkholderia panacisoli]KAA0998635.1 tautomerase family protein [Paraburkholderia panacisoli]